MLLPLFIRVLQMLCLLALQVLFLNHICILGYATPLIPVAFLLYFPKNTSRVGLLLWAFLMGIITDIFSNTPGINAASLTFVAMARPFLLRFLVTKDVAEDMVPNFRTLGKWGHVRFILFMVALHHFIYFLLESFSTAHLIDSFFSFISSLLLTMVVIIILEQFRSKNK